MRSILGFIDRDQFDVGRNFAVWASAGIPVDVAGIVHQGLGSALNAFHSDPTLSSPTLAIILRNRTSLQEATGR